jgi:drug/metabolite transporter (DMT)-like permease
MALAAPLATPRPLIGIMYMCLAATVFPVMNGLVQVLSAHYPSEQIVWVRTASHLVLALAILMPAHGFDIFRSQRLPWQLARSALLLCSTLCFFNGVKHLPLANAASISFMAPFIVTVLAWPMLGERFGVRRLVTVLVGFAGVLVVIRPGSDVFHWASLLIVGSAVFYALYQICTRKVAGQDTPETSAVYSALLGSIIMIPIAALNWTPFRSTPDLALMLCLGVLGGVGHYFVARAMTYAAANVIAPFHYWQIFGSVAVGYLITGKFPDAYTWTGAAIIIAAGIYLVLRETALQRGIASKIDG